MYSINCGLPLCQNAHEKQLTLSIGLRVTAVVLGIIGIIIGNLILFNVLGLGHLGTTAGWITFSVGAFTALVGVSLKCVKKSESHSPSTIKERLGPNLPTSYYTVNDEGELVLQYWNHNSLAKDKRPKKRTGAKLHPFPVAASPAHGESFAVAGSHRQNIIFDDGTYVTHVDFQLPAGAIFMKPNVDTMLMCCGIHQLLKEGVKFTQAIDVGAGSGFIAKYLALNNPQNQITAIDIDPKAATYMNSQEASMPENVKIIEDDGITYLSQYGANYDLIVSNPPYVPNKKETRSDKKIEVLDKSFWEGTGMIVHILEDTLPKMPDGGHLVVVVPSTSLKSKRLDKIFQEYSPEYQARVLYHQEVAYKAGFAGNNKVDHLLATDQEKTSPTHFEGANLDLFVGITRPGEPRDCKVEDGRRESMMYYWQMVYIIDFTKRITI